MPGTEAVALQLNRFSNEQGIAGKLDHHIKADPDILLPQWSPASSTNGISWRTYRLHVIIQHLAPTTVSGHYRAALRPSHADCPSQPWHYTDDDIPASSVLPTMLEDTNYILIYRPKSASQ